MNYYINIIDTTDDTLTTINEFAKRDSIVLGYKGGDEKDALKIVGSTLGITMEVLHSNNVDGLFSHLFTGDETRYRVELHKESDDALIWQGFLLPDSYNEPYKPGTFYIDLTATDGLGRLKGKNLPDSYYADEKSVVEILNKCLELTGLQLPMYLTSGVENYNEKLWHKIYLDGLYFSKNKKKKDAYNILQSLCESMVTCVYQSLGYWHVEGLNKRNLSVYNADEYTPSAEFVATQQLTRNIKDINQYLSKTPTVTMVPPYGKITVTHEREDLGFPDTIAVEQNEDWVLITGVIGKVYSTDWAGHGGFYAKASEPDYKVNLANDYVPAFDITKYVSLKKKLYFKANQKTKLSIKLFVNKPHTATSDDDYIFNDTWNTYFQYDIEFNGTILFSNRTGDVTDEEKIEFKDSRKGELNLEFITTSEGLLDIKLYKPYASVTTSGIESIDLDKLSVDVIDFEDEYISENIITSDYTNKSDIKLIFADDSTGFSKAFQLAKLREAVIVYDAITIPILYGFVQDGYNYSVVQLDGANLISDNIIAVYRGGELLSNLQVVYNYLNGEQMVIKTDELYGDGDFIVRVYNADDFTASRVNWEKWTDSIYGIEQLRFCDVVANIYRRMYAIPYPKFDGIVDMPIGFGDIIKFNYQIPSNYTPTNVSWRLDSGQSTITAAKAVYQNDDEIGVGDNIPPIVYAGEDIYLNDSETEASFDAESIDPDGFITSYIWEKLSGDDGDTIVTPNNEDTLVTGLIGDAYEYKITVLDNHTPTPGVGSDTIKVLRIKDYTMTLVEIYSDSGIIAGFGGEYVEKHFQLTITPALLNGFTMGIEGQLYINMNFEDGDEDNLARFIIDKNGAEILNTEIIYDDVAITTPLNFNYINTDTIIFKMRAEAELATPSGIFADSLVRLSIMEVEFAVGYGIVLGLPVEEEIYATTV